MAESSQQPSQVVVHPVTADRWADLETVFGPKGAFAGCWCMFWRLKRADFNRLKGEERKAMLKDLTSRNEVPGVLAYADGQPVGWCSIGPRENYSTLENSRTLKRIDDNPVWSIVCFFVVKSFRNRGMLSELLRGAVAYATQQGAKIVEGYPLDMQSTKLAGQTLHGCTGYMGIASAFREFGFVEVGRASEAQLIMRYTV